MRAKATISVFVLAALLAACGGGGHGGGSSLVPPVGPVQPITQNEKIKFTFTVPKQSVSAARRPETISPSTQSIGVTVNSGSQQIFNATPTTNGCQATESGTQCTVTIDAAVGNDSFDVSTYSGTNATGAILDHTTFNYTIVQDVTNTLTITLGPVVSTTADSGPGSLRQAVADANSGDVITFLLTTPATISLTSGVIALTKNVTISGPTGLAPTTRRRVHLPSAGVTVDGNNEQQIFTVGTGVTAAINNLILFQGHALSGNGGAIDDFGTLTLAAVEIDNSLAVGDGGAVGIEDGASLTASGSLFSGNKAPFGGAVWANTSATLLSIGTSTLSGNSSTGTNGYDEGGAIYTNIATTLTSDTVSSNTDSAIVTNGSGGVTISGGTYSANTAKGGYGGVLYVFGGGTNTISNNATFDSNVAGDPNTPASYGYGGAIYSDEDITIDHATFSNNVAGSASGGKGYGGAIRFDDGSLTITNSTFTANSAGGANASFGYGGAIDDETGNVMSVTGSTFTSNSAGGTDHGYGGAVELRGQVTVDSDSFSNNAAYATNPTDNSGSGDAYAGGAEIASFTDGERVTNSTFSGNTAIGGNVASGTYGIGSGAALYLSGSALLTLDGDTFSSNSSSGAETADGGALYAGESFSMNGGSFDGNTATVGGAGSGCDAASFGGGVSLASDATFTSVSFTNNKALISSAHTSGFCALARPRAAQRPHLTLVHHVSQVKRRPSYSGSSSSTNLVYGLGGAIEFCSCAGTLTLDKDTVSNNTAATDGGGLDLRGDTAAITDSTISGNSVTSTPGNADGGGGIMVADLTSTTINTSTIANNTVSGDTGGYDGGGGLMVTSSASPPPVLLTNDTITGNSAQYGGDIYNSYSSITLTNVTLMNGKATAASGQGGDYYGYWTNSLTIFGDIIAGGSASLQDNLGGDTQNTVITDNGYNIINTFNSSMNGASDFDNSGPTVDPLLSALASNGGPTQTMADSTSSPGWDFIPIASCTTHGVTTDQRGNARGDGSDNKCDSGAYEYP